MKDFVKLDDVRKIYHMGEVEIAAADGISFQIEKGEFAVVVGPSGAGKTTVLNILGGMDVATSGQVLVDGVDIAKYSGKQLTAYRRDDIGFVFQFYNLIPNLTALENVELALQICKDPLPAEEVLREVGLGDRLKNFPAQLSGGEQQRVSIARALAKNPKLLLCDEPTGALDYNTGKAILKLLQDTCREKGMTVAFNPSPIDGSLTQDVLALADVLFVNETEGGLLSGTPANENEAVLTALAERFPHAAVVLTVGGEGALYRKGGVLLRQRAYPVKAVDTTAAGDTFTGYFLAGMIRGFDPGKCLRCASMAAALAVSREGASASIPTWREVLDFSAAQGEPLESLRGTGAAAL